MAAPAQAVALTPVAVLAAAKVEEQQQNWKPVLDLRCDLTVDLAMPDFKIADLLKLRPGAVIDAHWRVGQDVPLRLNGTLVAWIEFEVVVDRLAVRLTELA
jgi:flagellar motor switch/type III secretory pathway protein FliN